MALAFREISGVNLSNIGQCSLEVFPSLRFARSVINFYISKIFFLADMKKFSFVGAGHLSLTRLLDAEVLLKMALNLRPLVRIILDVRSQVLELQNK